MAIVWGSKVYGLQLGVETIARPVFVSAGLPPQDPGGNNPSYPPSYVSYYSFTTKIYARSDSNIRYGFTTPLTYYMVTGFEQTKNVSYSSDVGDTSAKLLITYSTSMSPYSNRTREPQFGASLKIPIPGTNYVPKTNVKIILPKQPYGVPRDPKSASAVRNSDTQATVSWVRNADSATTDGLMTQPWTGVRIDRWDRASNKWTKLVDVTGTGSSYIDRGLKANNQFRHRVRAYNSSGYSRWVYTGYLATTPTAPSGITATRSGNNIIVKWTNRAGYSTGFEIWDNNVKIADVGNVTSYTHYSPSNTVTHQYKLKAKADSLLSGFSTNSNIVQLPAPPNAPTGVKANPLVYEANYVDESQAHLQWVHNPVDSSEQTQWEVETTSPGGITQVHKSITLGGGTKEYVDLDFWRMDFEWYSGEYKFRVRTRGEHATFSPWSAVSTFYLYNQPSGIITSPENAMVIDKSQVEVVWDYAQEEGHTQQGYSITLLEGSNRVYTGTGSGEATTFLLPYQLQDGHFYTIQLEVTASTSIKSDKDEVTFYVDYKEPNAPFATLQSGVDDGYNHFTIQNIDTETHEETLLNRVYRNVDTKSAWKDFEDQISQPDSVSNFFPQPTFNNPINPPSQVVRSNYVPNGSMQAPGIPNTYYISSGGVLEYTTEEYRVGVQSLKLNPNNPFTFIMLISSKGIIDEPVQNWVTVSAYVKAPVGALVRLEFNEYTPSNLHIKQHSPSFEQGTGEWRRFSYQAQVTTPGNRMAPILRVNEALEPYYVDCWMVEHVGQTLPYFNGSWSEDPNIEISWEGAEYNSVSRGKAALVDNMSTDQTTGLITTWSHESNGDSRLRVERRLGSEATSLSYNPVDNTFLAGMDLSDGLTIQATFTVEQPLQGVLQNDAIGIKATYLDENDAFATKQINAPNTPGTYNLSLYVPVGLINFDLVHGGPQGSGPLYITKVGVYEGEYEDRWFDGNTPPFFTQQGLQATPSWTGAEDNSATNLNFTFPGFIADEWEFVGEFPPNAEVVDFKGLTNGKTIYMIEAVSAIPSMARTLFPVVTASPRVWISHGDTFEEAKSIFYNIEVGETKTNPDASRQYFDGRPLPLLFNGIASERSIAVSGSVYPQEGRGSSYEDLFDILNRPGPHLYRDMDGRRFYADLEEFSSTRTSKKLYQLSFKAVEVDYENF